MKSEEKESVMKQFQEDAELFGLSPERLSELGAAHMRERKEMEEADASSQNPVHDKEFDELADRIIAEWRTDLTEVRHFMVYCCHFSFL